MFQKLWRTLLILTILSFHALYADGLIKPSDKNIQYMGRIDRSDPEAPAFDWAGVNIKAGIQGDRAAFLVDDPGGRNYFNLYVDGKAVKVFKAGIGKNRFEVEGLDKGKHTLVLSKRTEAFQGPVAFKGIELGSRTFLTPLPPPSERKIEFIGASWTNGYGNEGVTYGHCDDLAAVSNVDRSFSVLCARDLDAQYHVTAVSGRGIVRNYGDPKTRSDDNMPNDFKRRLFNRPVPGWDFKEWVPDAVVINLGLNDFSSEPRPNDREFVEAFTGFLEQVREDYPKAEIFCFNDEGWPNFKDKVLEAVQARRSRGDARVRFVGYQGFGTGDLGCDWHPNTGADRVLAGILEPVIRETMGWKKAGGN